MRLRNRTTKCRANCKHKLVKLDFREKQKQAKNKADKQKRDKFCRTDRL